MPRDAETNNRDRRPPARHRRRQRFDKRHRSSVRHRLNACSGHSVRRRLNACSGHSGPHRAAWSGPNAPRRLSGDVRQTRNSARDSRGPPRSAAARRRAIPSAEPRPSHREPRSRVRSKHRAIEKARPPSRPSRARNVPRQGRRRLLRSRPRRRPSKTGRATPTGTRRGNARKRRCSSAVKCGSGFCRPATSRAFRAPASECLSGLAIACRDGCDCISSPRP